MLAMSLKLQPEDFQHILRICNTNIDGRTTVGAQTRRRSWEHICFRAVGIYK